MSSSSPRATARTPGHRDAGINPATDPATDPATELVPDLLPGLPELEGILPEGAGTLSGPWASAFWFTVHGEVRSKSNHRRGDRRGGQSTWSLLESYELGVKAAARGARPAGWDQGRREDPVSARPRIVAFCVARSALDAGNLDKSLLDALEGVVMVNDAQVCWTTAASIRTRRAPGVLVALAQLPAGAGIAQQAAAAAALTAGALQHLR